MSSNYLDIIRPGINTTFQDKGRDHLYHIGIPFSGAMDNRNYLIANKLVNNKLDSEPELINGDPCGEGWIVKGTVKEVDDVGMSYQEYESFIS